MSNTTELADMIIERDERIATLEAELAELKGHVSELQNALDFGATELAEATEIIANLVAPEKVGTALEFLAKHKQSDDYETRHKR